MKCSLRYTWDGGEGRGFCRVCEAIDGVSDFPRRKSIGREGASCCRSRRRNTPAWSIRVWFWCVRGRLIWAIDRDGSRHSNPVSMSLDLRPAHTPYGGSRVRPTSSSKSLDRRPAHTPYDPAIVSPSESVACAPCRGPVASGIGCPSNSRGSERSFRSCPSEGPVACDYKASSARLALQLRSVATGKRKG